MKNSSFVAGAVLGALAVGIIFLLSGGWGGMMGPGWGMMGPWMMAGWWMGFNPLGWLIILAAVFLTVLAIWVAQSQGKKK